MASPDSMKEHWSRYKLTLRELWKQDKLSTKTIMKRMEDVYQFKASKNAYDRQFKEWGWRKNLTAKQWTIVEHIIKKRKRDQDKESEVRLDGDVVCVPQRAKRHRLTLLEELELQMDQTASDVPAGVVIQTPFAFAEQDFELEIRNLPWLLFLRDAKERILHVSPSHARTVSHNMEVDKNILDISPGSRTDLGLITGFLGSILPSDSKAKELISCIHRTSDGQIRLDEVLDILSTIRSLGTERSNQILKLTASLTGPVATTFILALLRAIFVTELSWHNSIQAAQILLPRVKKSVNLRMSFNSWNPAEYRAYDMAMLASCLQSVSMARLFIEHGGNLCLAENPFRVPLASDDQTRFDLYKLFIESDHPDLKYMQRHTNINRHPTLARMALRRCPEFDILPALALAIDQKDEITAQIIERDLLDQRGCVPDYPKILAIAANLGYESCIDILISRSTHLDVPVSLWVDYGTETATALQFAISTDNQGIAERLIHAGASIMSPVQSSLAPPLWLALRSGNAQLAHQLLARGAFSDPKNFTWTARNYREYYGLKSIVGTAIRIGDETLVDELLTLGADGNEGCVPFDNERFCERSAVALALRHCGESLASKLLTHGAPLGDGLCTYRELSMGFVYSLNITNSDLSNQDCHGKRPLQYAMGGGTPSSHRHDLARYYISLGASTHGQGLFEQALFRDCAECLDILLSTTNPCQPEIAYAAALRGNELLLVQSLSISGVIHSFNSQVAVSRQWIRGPIDCSLASSALQGALERWYAFNDRSLFFKLFALEIDFTAACMTSVLQALCLLTEKHCIPTKKDMWPKGVSVRTDTIKKLLRAGTSPNWNDCAHEEYRTNRYKGPSCLWHLVATDEQDLAELFLQYGADPTPTYGWFKTTCLYEAANSGNVNLMRKLISAEENFHRPAFRNTCTNGRILQKAVRNGRLEAVKFLLHELDVSPNEPATEEEGTTAIQLAAMTGNIPIAHELIKAGANVNVEPLEWSSNFREVFNGNTALEFAAAHGRLDMVAYLINVGADIGTSEFGKHQFSLALQAARQGFPVVAEFLEDERRRLHGDLAEVDGCRCARCELSDEAD